MKVCPKCHTRYTDVTLKFCLQDGAILTAASEQKTEAFDTDAFAQQETIAVDASKTNGENEILKSRYEAPPLSEGRSEPTLERPRRRRSVGGIGFIMGLVVGASVLGIAVVAGLAIWGLPDFSAGNSNTNVNKQLKKPGKVTRDLIDTITASSSRRPYRGIPYIPANAIDGDLTTGWCEGGAKTGKGEWLKITFTKPLELNELVIAPGYFKDASIWQKNNRVASVRLQFSNGRNRIFDFPDEMKTQRVNLEGVETSFVKISINEVYMGTTDVDDTLISEISFTALK